MRATKLIGQLTIYYVVIAGIVLVAMYLGRASRLPADRRS